MTTFSTLDYVVLILYSLLMIGIGWWSSRHQNSTDDYGGGGNTALNLLMYAFTGLISSVLFGYLFSVLLPEEAKKLEGLTIYSL